MAEVVKTIQTSGGDYTTLAGWEAAIPADQAVGNPWVANINEAMDPAAFTINVSNANSAPHRVTVAAAYRFYEGANWTKGGAGTDLVAMQSDTDFARVRMTAGVSIQLSTPAVIVEYLWVEHNQSNTNYRHFTVQAAGDYATIRRCVLVNAVGGRIMVYALGTDLIMHDCVAYNPISSYFLRADANNATLEHCTFLGDGNTSTGLDVGGGATGSSVSNTLILHTFVGRFQANISEWASGDYNACEVSSVSAQRCPGANSWFSVSPATIITAPGASVDPRMLVAVSGTYQGTDLGYGTDIEGVTRTAHTLGAFEVAGNAQITATIACTGAVSAQGSAVASATVTGTGAVTAQLGAVLAATIPCTGAVSGADLQAAGLSATIACTGSASAAIGAVLAATLTGTGAVAGANLVGAQNRLEASLTGSGALSGALTQDSTAGASGALTGNALGGAIG